MGEASQAIQWGFDRLGNTLDENNARSRAEEERGRQEAEKKRPLTPYEQHVAEHVHRLVFGNEPVGDIIASYKGGGGGVSPGGGGQAPMPQGAPPPSQGAPPQPANPVGGMGVLGAVKAIGGFGDLQGMQGGTGLSAAMQGTPPPPGASPAGGGLQSASPPPPQQPPGPPPPMPPSQGQGQQARDVLSQPPPRRGPDGRQPPLPQNKQDFDALMNFVHSGVPGAMMQQQNVEKRLSSVEQENSLNRSSRERVAGQNNDTRTSIASSTEQGRNDRWEKQLLEMHATHNAAHMDRLAAIQQRANAVSARIAAAAKKGDNSELNSLGKELGALESELKTETGAAEKFSGQASNVLSTPEGQKAAAKAQAEAEKRAAEVKLALREKQAELAAARKKPAGAESSGASGSISSGGAADTITVTGPYGKPITMQKK